MLIRYHLLVVIIAGFYGLLLVDLAVQTRRQSHVLRFTSQPMDVIDAEGKNASFNCVASSTDAGSITYTWMVNESTLLSPSRKIHFSANSLTVINLQRHIDNGVYRCIASNKIGSILSNRALLQVAYFDVLETNQSVTFQVKQYESKLLEAPKVCSVPPARFLWKREGHGIIKDGRPSNLFISPNGDLSIVNPTNSYEFIYIVQNPVTNQTFHKNYTLSIQGEFKNPTKLRFMKSPTNKIINAGLPVVVFECIVSYGVRKRNGVIIPSVVNINWFKDNNKISVKNNPKYGYLRNDTSITMKLVVHSPGEDDDGDYYCSASNEQSPTIARLKVRDPPPIFSTQLTPIVLTSPGKTAKIGCPFCDDDMEFIWYKNAKPVPLNDSRFRLDDGSLVISSVRTSDAGLYQVLIRNNGGEAIGYPTYLRVKDTTSSSIHPSLTKTPRPTRTVSASFYPQNSVSMATLTIYTPTPFPAFTQHGRRSTEASSITRFSTFFFTPSTVVQEAPTVNVNSVSGTTPTLVAKSAIIQTTAKYGETSTTVTSWTTEAGGWVTTETAATKSTIDLNKPNNSANDDNKDLFLWISAAVGVFIIGSTVIVSAVCCNIARKRRSRKQNFKVEEPYNDLEMTSLEREVERAGPHLVSATDRRSPRNIPRTGTKRLLTEDDEMMYAPVLALDNIAADMNENKQRPTQSHLYDEPIKNTKRKPYQQPSTPALHNDHKARRVSIHSYLELLGPEQRPNDVYEEPIEGKVNGFVRNAVNSSEDIYDCAREGVLTDTLRRIIKQEAAGGDSTKTEPLYNVLEGPQPQQGKEYFKRESSLYANPEDILFDDLQQPSSKERLSHSESQPLYHILEPLGDSFDENKKSHDVYGYYKAEDTIKRNSLYQPLVNFSTDGKSRDINSTTNIYQPLDLKARNPSAASSVNELTNNELKEVDSFNDISDRDASFLDEPNRLSYSEDSEGLYQPLNNPDRCPLDVSKPRASFSNFRQSKRDSFLSVGETSSRSSRTSSINSTQEPTLHTIDLPLSSSLKEESCSGRNKKAEDAKHRRNLSDTHSVVNISRLGKRRASTEGLRLSTRPKVEPKIRHKRNHSDAGLCPVNLSLLRVNIDLELPNQNQLDNSNSLYTSLVKKS